MIILLIIVSSCSGSTEVNITRGDQSSLYSAGRTTDKAWDKNLETDVSKADAPVFTQAEW